MQSTYNKIKYLLKNYLNNQTKILLANSSWVFLSNGIRVGLAFVRSIIVARGLGIEIYGIYAVVQAFISAILELFNLNVGTALIKFGAEYLAEQRSDKLVVLLKLCLLITFCTAILGILLISGILLFFYDSFINYPGLTSVIIILSASVSLSFFDYIGQSILRLFFKFKLNSILQIIVTVFQVIVIGVTLLIYPKNLIFFMVAVISGNIIGSIITNVSVYYEIKEKIMPYYKCKYNIISEDIKRILKFVFANSGSRTLKTILNQGDVLLLGILSTPVQVGFYSIAKKLGYSILILIDPLVNAVFPQFSKITSEKKYKELKGMIKQTTFMILLPVSLLLLIVILWKQEIIILVYGAQYKGAENPLVLHLFSALISAITFWSLSLILSLGLVTFRFFASLASLIVGALIAIILTPEYGAVGTAVGVFIANLILSFLLSYVSIKMINK